MVFGSRARGGYGRNKKRKKIQLQPVHPQEADDPPAEENDVEMPDLKRRTVDYDSDDDQSFAGVEVDTSDSDPAVEDFMKEEHDIFGTDCVQRLSIAFCFVNKYQAEKDSKECPWDGKGGIIANIRKDLGLNPRCKVKYILEDVLNCQCAGTQYTGERRKHSDIKPGPKVIITTDSPEAQIVADSMEAGMSCRLAWHLVNEYRRQQELESLAFSAAYGLIARLKPKVKKVKQLKQGSNDETSCWAISRDQWVTQLLICYGKLTLTAEDFPDKVLPACFDSTKLRKYKEHGSFYIDEAHSKVAPGGDNCVGGSKKEGLTFPRDENGKLDLENGVHSKEQLSLMKCKFTEEVRMCFGVAKVIPLDENGAHLPEEGRRMRPFDYSRNNILTIKDYKAKMGEVIKRVKELPIGGKEWVIKGGEAGFIYRNDLVSALKGCGRVRVLALEKSNIHTVSDLAALNSMEQQNISQLTKENGHVSLTLLAKLCEQARTCRDEDRPADVDYRKAQNPYKEKYGDDCEKKISQSAAMRPFRCITELIEHVIAEGHRIFKGTTHEHDWVFYHDALSLMTAKDTKEWMCEKGYLERWILPQNGLLKDNPALKRFWDRPIGDSPELMPLDNTLNKDIHEAVIRHMAATMNLEDDDPRKFSMSTPKRGASAYLRVNDPVEGVAPTSERIIQDIDRVFDSMVLIRAKKGCVIDDASVRNGHRQEAAMVGREGGDRRGGARVRKLDKHDYKSQHWHRDAEEALQMKLEDVQKKVQIN